MLFIGGNTEPVKSGNVAEIVAKEEFSTLRDNAWNALQKPKSYL